jgi:hypothetical protein
MRQHVAEDQKSNPVGFASAGKNKKALQQTIFAAP